MPLSTARTTTTGSATHSREAFFQPIIQAKCACSEERKLPVQPKLTLGAAGDRFEQEADLVANTVMRKEAGPIESISTVTPSHLQRESTESCSLDEEPKEEGEEVEATEEEETKQEQQEEAAAAAASAAENADDSAPGGQGSPGGSTTSGDTPLRRKSRLEPTPPLTGDLESRIERSRGGGMPLPANTRAFMESRFGYNFAGVRIHTGTYSELLNRDIRSLAFTTGLDIYFAPGQYQPDTEPGRLLLAHELTHVVQQTGGPGSHSLVHEKGDPRQINMAGNHPEVKPYYYYSLSGSKVHHHVEKILRDLDGNLVTEAAIPGANRFAFAPNLIGVADLYKSKPPKTVSGVKAYHNADKDSDFLSMDSPEVVGTWPKVKSSPSRPLNPGGTRPWRGQFPSAVSLGEIKPASAGKIVAGVSQLFNYEQGYKDFVAKAAKVRGQPTPTFDVSRLSIALPAGLDFDNWSTQHQTDYTPAIFGDRRLWVVSIGNGIYVYRDLAKGLRGPPPAEFMTEIASMRKIQQGLTNPHPGIKQMGQGRYIQRTEERPDGYWKEQGEAWEKQRKEWGTGFRKYIKSDGKEYREKLKFEKDLGRQSSKRPAGEHQEVSDYKSLMFWSGFGGKFIGKIRFLLGSAWDKGVAIFETMKKKMSAIRGKVKETSEESVGGFGWRKVLIKVILAAAKMAVTAFITESFNFFADCFHSAMDTVIEKFKKEIDAKFGKQMCEARKFFEESKERLDTEWGGAIKKIEELLAEIQEAKRWYDIATNLITLIRLGVQAISCLTPPALGCLWGLLAQLGIDASVALLIGTQWFNDNIVTPVVRDLVRKYAAPEYQKLINRALGPNLSEYHCHIADKPFPSVDFEVKGGIQEGSSEMRDHRDKWEAQNHDQIVRDLQAVLQKPGGRPVSEAELQALVKRIQASKLTPEQLKPLIEQARDPASGKIDIVKAGLNVDRANPPASATATTTPEQGKRTDPGTPPSTPEQGKHTDPAASPSTPQQGRPASPPTSTSTSEKERKYNVEEAKRNNIIYQKMRGWDPFTFYKKPGIEAGSKEFADGVYDLQQALYVHADGILGDETLVAFYKHNKLREDVPYKESQQALEAQKAAREKALEAQKAAREKAATEKSAHERAAQDAANGFKTLYGYECIPEDPNKWIVPHGVVPYIHDPAIDVLIAAPTPDRRVLTQQPVFITMDIVVDGRIEVRIVNVEVQSLRVWEALVTIGGGFSRFNLELFMRNGIQVPTSKGQMVMNNMTWSVP